MGRIRQNLLRSACPGIVNHVTDRPSGCHDDLIHLACFDKAMLNKTHPLARFQKSCEIKRACRGLGNASGGYAFPATFEDWSACQAQTPNTQLKRSCSCPPASTQAFPWALGQGPYAPTSLVLWAIPCSALPTVSLWDDNLPTQELVPL